MRSFHHLQVLHDEEVEARIGRLIPHIENWLNGTLPLPRKEDMRPIGVVIADGKIDIPLRPIRDMIYEGVSSIAVKYIWKPIDHIPRWQNSHSCALITTPSPRRTFPRLFTLSLGLTALA